MGAYIRGGLQSDVFFDGKVGKRFGSSCATFIIQLVLPIELRNILN